MMKLLLLLLILPIFFISVYADPHTIETANNDLTSPGCVETEIGCYTPNILTVDVGHTITMTNTDEAGIHTFTSGTVDGFAATPDGIFDSGMLQFGDSFEYTADTVGEFSYYCTLHVWMQGVIIVEANSITLQTDQPQYLHNDVLFLRGIVAELLVGDNIDLSIINPDGNTAYADTFSINEDLTFDTNFNIEGVLFDKQGTYTVVVVYGNSSNTITFEIISTNINFQTNKDIHYMDSVISVNGTMLNIDWNEDFTITSNIYYDDGTLLESWTGDILNQDGTFAFTISTIDKSTWDYTGDIQMDVTIQNYTSTIHFQYFNEPDMTNEALYEHIINIYQIFTALTNDEDIDLEIITNIEKEVDELQEKQKIIKKQLRKLTR